VESSDTFDSILHAARVAREAGDRVGFRQTWDQLAKIWSDCADRQELTRVNVSREMHSVYNMIVGEGNGMPPPMQFTDGDADTLSHDDSQSGLDGIPDLGGLDNANLLDLSDVQGSTVPPPPFWSG